MVLNAKEGYNNGGRFYYHTKNEIIVEDNRKTCDFGVINVPVGDPEDMADGR